jgi:hypothetical protein
MGRIDKMMNRKHGDKLCMIGGVRIEGENTEANLENKTRKVMNNREGR